jgi:hypothetical protein
MLVKP